MSGIFISYRREDSAPYAGRLYDLLSARFGADKVFMDVDDIPPGADFAAHIGAKVASCDAMIVVVGKHWLASRNDAGQLRLSDPNDFVALEVALGLQRGILVIPALVGGATMPKPSELPQSLRELGQRNALGLRDEEFKRDVDELIGVLGKLPALRLRPEGKSREQQELWHRRKKALLWKAPLTFSLITFASWWQWRKDGSVPEPPVDAKAVAILTGGWSSPVTYGWGDKYTEKFFFQPEGNRLYGTATFLGYKRGIDDGKIAGDEISFSVHFQEESSSGSREHKNYYGGKIVGNEIRFRMQDDRGSVPLDFTATKIGQ
jgi:hypothetical protein